MRWAAVLFLCSGCGMFAGSAGGMGGGGGTLVLNTGGTGGNSSFTGGIGGGGFGGAGGGGVGGGVAGGSASDGGAAPPWSEVYAAVITTRCAPCHTTPNGNGIVLGALDMSSQQVAWDSLFGIDASGISCAGAGARVLPSHPEQSILFLKVSLTDPSPCGSKMPFGGPPLAPNEVELIRAWIAGGALNPVP